MLHVKNLTFAYTSKPVLKNLNFSIEKGEHVSIIGASGSGKSTLLKLIYGEHDLNKGQIFWNKTEILGPKYNLVIGYDFIKYVAQEFDLMPFTSVSENVGQFLSNFFPEEKEERISELLDVVELTDFAKIKVKLLSGGQKQRVALARALAKDPELILLDEPFSHIDNFKKHHLRRRLFKYLKQKKITCVVATHDKEDVLGYSDNIIVLNDSKIIANKTPETLYENPRQSLIAAFFGEYSTLEPYGIVYAHQLKVVGNSDIEVVISNSYFKGNYYLIEAELNGETMFFNHNSKLENQSKVFLEIFR
ncbi:ABC transporter ATP-binding protein [Hanstruepera marina]|uniref:ABC transporter ATP-binding protein n=1 Tax=Hanstruepera marina TaxID=2873265 RepID=UPI001CA717D1|nr:ABC transporter ATP-binding protein [Hanstruepera marina]